MELEIFKKIISAGIKAPSGDNVQPWKVIASKDFNSFVLECEKDEIDFFDFKNSALMIDSGTFLKNIEIAAQNFNYKTQIEFDNDINSLKMAKVKFVFDKDLDKNILSNSLLVQRATSRENYSKQKLDLECINQIEKLNSDLIDVKLFESNSKLNEILYKADIIRLETRGAHNTLYHNLKYSKKEINSKEGLDVNTLGIPFFASLNMKILSNWNVQRFLAFTKFNRAVAYISTKKLLNNSQGIGIISINNFNKKDTLKAAMTFQQIWLILTKYDGFLQPFASLPFFLRRLSFDDFESFSSRQVLELNNIKKELYDYLGFDLKKDLVMIFRYGKAKKPKVYSLRKDVDNFIKYS